MNKNRGKLDNTLAAMFSNIDYRSNYLFYAHMLAQCSIKIDKDMPAPAAVSFQYDHYNLYINPDKYDVYTLENRLAILKHEMLHIILGHTDRKESRDHYAFNVASDCALNQQIDEDHLPEGCVLPKSLGESLGIDVPKNLTAEQYYDLILQNQKDNSETPEFTEIDDHSKWEESVGSKELQKDLTKKMLEKANIETIKGKGKSPSEFVGWLKLFTRNNEVKWEQVLRNIVGNKKVGTRSTIMKKDRRFPGRPDLRGKTKDRKFNLLIIADVSGSMSEKALLETLAEVRNICDLTKTDIDLIQIDTQAYEPEKLSKNTKLLNRKGSGGTELFPAIKKAQESRIDFQAAVVLTDGGLWGEDIMNFRSLNKKIIWLIESKGNILPEMNEGKMQAFKLKGIE